MKPCARACAEMSHNTCLNILPINLHPPQTSFAPDRDSFAPLPKTELPDDFSPDAINVRFSRKRGLEIEHELTVFRDLHLSLGNERSNWQAVFRKHLEYAARDHGRIRVPEWVPLAEWKQFLDMRVSIGKTTTPGIQRLLLQKLNEFHNQGQNVKAILDQSSENGWASLYPAKGAAPNYGTLSEKMRLQRERLERNAAPEYGDAMENLRAQRERLGMRLPEERAEKPQLSITEAFMEMRRKYEKDLK